jgi:hypothetical protein
VRPTVNVLIVVLWAMALATFEGWQMVAADHGAQAAREYFYVAQGAFGAVLALALLLRLSGWTVYLLAIYVATEQALVAICGAAWYLRYNGTTPLRAMCNQAHGWEWVVVAVCAAVLLVYWWSRHADESAS